MIVAVMIVALTVLTTVLLFGEELKPIYPVNCPHCRHRLTAKRRLPVTVRWCHRCRCTVQYVTQQDLEQQDDFA